MEDLISIHAFMAVQTIFSKNKKEMLNWMWNGGRNTLEVRNQKFYLVHGFVGDTKEQRVWNRPKLNTPNPFKDKTLIIGHTPVALLHGKTEKELWNYSRKLNTCGGHFKIEHAEGFIDIDCGCGSDIPGARLACLRLDDMKEFYI